MDVVCDLCTCLRRGLQQSATAMGYPVSPVVANIYMEMFEEMALSTAEEKLEDTWMTPACVMKKEQVNNLLEHLNKQHHTMKFTMEKENRSLPFLDTLLRRREDGRLDISVYRKPTHTLTDT